MCVHNYCGVGWLDLLGRVLQATIKGCSSAAALALVVECANNIICLRDIYGALVVLLAIVKQVLEISFLDLFDSEEGKCSDASALIAAAAAAFPLVLSD